jgi:hypothetical protein
MLNDSGVPVDWLFDTALVPTDTILDQCLRNRVPKYDFAYDGLTDADFARVGVTRTSHFYDDFEAARPYLLACIARDGFVLLAGDVFYFPHCPEYRHRHLFHLVILTGFDTKSREWTMIDDNAASVLCHYRWGDAMVAAFYNNSIQREFRSYQRRSRSTDEISRDTLPAFADRMATPPEDSYRLLLDLRDLLSCPWFAPSNLYAALSDAFAILSGSRRCFAEFLSLAGFGEQLSASATAIAQGALKLRDAIARARLTGITDPSRLADRAAALAEQDRRLRDALAEAIQHGFASDTEDRAVCRTAN